MDRENGIVHEGGEPTVVLTWPAIRDFHIPDGAKVVYMDSDTGAVNRPPMPVLVKALIISEE